MDHVTDAPSIGLFCFMVFVFFKMECEWLYIAEVFMMMTRGCVIVYLAPNGVDGNLITAFYGEHTKSELHCLTHSILIPCFPTKI